MIRAPFGASRCLVQEVIAGTGSTDPKHTLTSYVSVNLAVRMASRRVDPPDEHLKQEDRDLTPMASPPGVSYNPGGGVRGAAINVQKEAT